MLWCCSLSMRKDTLRLWRPWGNIWILLDFQQIWCKWLCGLSWFLEWKLRVAGHMIFEGCLDYNHIQNYGLHSFLGFSVIWLASSVIQPSEYSDDACTAAKSWLEKLSLKWLMLCIVGLDWWLCVLRSAAVSSSPHQEPRRECLLSRHKVVTLATWRRWVHWLVVLMLPTSLKKTSPLPTFRVMSYTWWQRFEMESDVDLSWGRSDVELF